MKSMRSSLVGLLVLAALAAGCGEETTTEPPEQFPRMRDGQVLFTFVPHAGTPAITSIAVAGSFDPQEGDPRFWNPGHPDFQMTRLANGNWELTRPLAAGSYEYKFVFNGDQWAQNMCNDATWGNPTHGRKVDPAVASCSADPFGGANGVLNVQ